MRSQATSPAVPFLDVRAAYLELRSEIDEALSRVLDSGSYVLGTEVSSFEREFAEFIGVRHCIGTGNGLDALRLALQAMGVGSGDEVVVPANTYIATWLAVSHTGAVPIPVDPDIRTFNIDPGKIEAALTDRTRVLLPVHLYGRPADMDPIRSAAQSRGIRVLEDAAQAHGARYKGRRVGGLGDAAAWSFYPSKNLGAIGDAGAVTTDDDQLADRLRMLNNYGSLRKNRHEVQGYNSRMDPMQAAVLRVKLSRLEEWNTRRTMLADRYREELKETDLILPEAVDVCDSANHLFVVRTGRRSELMEKLKSDGIGTMVHYPVSPHLQPAYRDLDLGKGRFPVAERLQDEVLSLPIGPHLDPGSVSRVAGSVRDFGTRTRRDK